MRKNRAVNLRNKLDDAAGVAWAVDWLKDYGWPTLAGLMAADYKRLIRAERGRKR